MEGCFRQSYKFRQKFLKKGLRSLAHAIRFVRGYQRVSLNVSLEKKEREMTHRYLLPTAALTGAITLLSATAGAATPVDLNTWIQRGASGVNGGIWNVENGGDSVFQSENGDPTYYVSPNDFFNTTVQGGFKQNQSRVGGFNDDDFIGFVLAGTSRATTALMPASTSSTGSKAIRIIRNRASAWPR